MTIKRVHVLGLPHTQTIRAGYSWCAYTQKIRLFCDMLSSLGWDVILYAGTQNEAHCAEHVEIIHDGDRGRWFGDVDWNQEVFNRWDANDAIWQTMNARIIEAMKTRAEAGDVLGIIAGFCQKPVADAYPWMPALEWGIGYEGVFAPYRIYESYAWMHWLWGRDHINDGRFYDAVIPNAFDPNEFEFRGKKDDYLLFMGRHTPRKGLEVVAELAKDWPVVAAGQAKPEERIPGTEYVGVVQGGERASLLARARAVLVPTFYIEPFGGVAVEAQLSGTPVLTTDFGAFAETVHHGVSGFRCHRMGEFREAAERVSKLNPATIRLRAEEKYSTLAVAPQYDAYLEHLGTLDGAGWYA